MTILHFMLLLWTVIRKIFKCVLNCAEYWVEYRIFSICTLNFREKSENWKKNCGKLIFGEKNRKNYRIIAKIPRKLKKITEKSQKFDENWKKTTEKSWKFHEKWTARKCIILLWKIVQAYGRGCGGWFFVVVVVDWFKIYILYLCLLSLFDICLMWAHTGGVCVCIRPHKACRTFLW